MKKNRIYLILVIVLAIIAIFIYFSQSKSTYKKELRDFAVADTASIDKIFLVDKENYEVLLERNDGSWTLNGKYQARQDFVNLLLKTIKRVYVKAPVAKSGMEYIIKNLSTKSTKIEIYQNGELTKTYFIGGPTQDQHGTFMLLKNSSKPFVVSIPGFRGYLSTRYNTNYYQWRSQVIFINKYPDIKSITINNIEKPTQSFKILKSPENNLELVSLNDKKIIPTFDTLALKTFVAHFKNVSFDKFLENTDEVRVKDSVLAAQPMAEFIVENIYNDKITLKTYRRPNYRGLTNDEGEEYPYDLDFLYGITQTNELVLVQYYVIDPLYKELSDFRK